MATTFALAVIIDGIPHEFGELVGDSFVAKNGDTATTLKVNNPKPVIVEGIEYNISWRSQVTFKAATAKKVAAASKRVSAAEAVNQLLAKKNPTLLSKQSMHDYAEEMNRQILAAAEAAKGHKA